MREHSTACGATGHFSGSRGVSGAQPGSSGSLCPLPAGSCPRSSRPLAGRWRRRRSCWTRLAGRRRSCCTVCSRRGTAPRSPWLPERCRSSPRSTASCRGTAGASLQPCEPRAALTSAPRSGQGSRLAEPSRRLTDRSDGAFHGTLTPAFPQPVRGCRGTLASYPCSPCTPSSGERLSGVKGVSQDTQTCIELDLTQCLALSMNSTSTAPGHEDDEEATRTGRGQALGG